MVNGGKDLALVEVNQARPRAELDTLQRQKVLDTPRTREACKRLGLIVEDLHFRSPDSFANPGDPKEKVQLRFDHFERRRKDRLAQVLAERAKVIAHHAKKGGVPGVQSGQFLAMLENLFEQEAKRLETDLKGQLRQHSTIARENEDQLRKENQLMERETNREMRRAASLKHFADNSSKTRRKLEERLHHNAEVVAKMDEDFREKQITHARQLLAEEERMERFLEEKSSLSADRAAALRDKFERMKEKNEQLEEERRQEAEAKLQELDQKITQTQARREEDLKRRQLQSEEQHLHMMDVREQKSRIDRVDGNRRAELKEHISSNGERIDMLLALKDQLLEQRRGRNTRAEASKASRGFSLKRDCLPGPGQYEAPPSTLADVPAAKFGTAKVAGVIEDAVKGFSQTPAPGSYENMVLPNGDRLDKHGINGVKFRTRDRDTYLDDAVKAKDHIPAPGLYEAKSQLSHRGPEMRRDRVANVGKESQDKKQFPAWAGPSSETPGPANYCVDEYMRKEVLRRAKSSLPRLTRDMLRSTRVA